MDLKELIRQAGVVGAGGGGFPAHIKAGAKAEYVIANGAECEPLIHKDYEVMLRYPGEILRGMRLMMESTGARKGIIGVKEKNKKAVEALSSAIRGQEITIHLLGDFYPSGDEYLLVYESTRRLIPPRGIPIDVGIVVNNVETLYNISRAAEGVPVTEKFISVSGAVNSPATFIAPIGMSYLDAIKSAGGFARGAAQENAVFVGGIMMGRLETDFSLPVTKTTAGLIVLPREHLLIRRKMQPEKAMHRIGKSACDQCSYCTELCPRYILGYDVQPHRVMRSLGFTSTGEDIWNQYAVLCCSCGLCTLYACPESLFPKEACDKAKTDLKRKGIQWSGRNSVVPHQMYEERRTPMKQLVNRLGIKEFDISFDFREKRQNPRKVELPLSQHAGSPSHSVVKTGQKVTKGDCIAEIVEGKLGARVHASIDGIIKTTGDTIVIEEA